MPANLTLTIVNKKGLHARAAAKFVKVVAAYDAQVRVTKLALNGEEGLPEVQGGSILGLMMLGADAGSTLIVSADGAQAEEVAQALKALVEGKFGEEE